MKCKYKKFLKAAYINYEEDYCGNGSSTFTKPTITTPIIVITGTTAIIACAVSGVTIYYTLDGSTPTSSSTQYTGTITLTQSCTIKAIAVKPGLTDSAVASENYIHYLTAWRLVGNSTVHTDEYLTQWKVSGNSQIQQYLTQWKVEGNSVVDNNAILSCGDLGQDGYYHVKISNGVNVFDIALTEPLRKVDDVADNIEFVNGIATLTRKIAATKISDNSWTRGGNVATTSYGFYSDNILSKASSFVLLCAGYSTVDGSFYWGLSDLSIGSSSSNPQRVYIKDLRYTDGVEFLQGQGNNVILYELATPTTETIQAPQISVSPTNTYSSANTTPYSAFTYANPLIYSCGDYSDVDGKYHVKISNGVTIYDIPLTEPLRKVNDVADTIEFVNGTAIVTRCFAKGNMGDYSWSAGATSESGVYRMRSSSIQSVIAITSNILCAIYDTVTSTNTYNKIQGVSVSDNNGIINIYDENYNQSDSVAAFKTAMNGVELIYELATPTTETIQVSPFPISATDTYTSANDTPYSAFEYKKNVEIWSCGEYSAVDGKYHVLVQPEGGSIADIALDEPLRKVNDVADSIEFDDGATVITRNIDSILLKNASWEKSATNTTDVYRWVSDSIITLVKRPDANSQIANILCSDYSSVTANNNYSKIEGVSVQTSGYVSLYNASYNQEGDKDALILTFGDAELLYTLATPTTETIQVPQIQEADSYTCEISQGAKAVSWSSFETE